MTTSSHLLYFKPVQPAATYNEKDVSYIEYFPQAFTRQSIYCYWELKSKRPLDKPFHYRVVADGCMDIFFDLYSLPKAYIMGFANAYNAFPLSGVFHYLGIRFLPAAFATLFNMDASLLTDQVESLDQVNSKLHKALADGLFHLADQAKFSTIYCNNTQFIDRVICHFEAYFSNIVVNNDRQTDARLGLALEKVLQTNGSLSTEKLDAYVSPRQLRRLFKFYVGDSPKAFSKIVRFQHFLSYNPTRDSIRMEKLFFNMGYYDQAHFIKDFKNLYGLTPKLALK